jgi:hypothetical protein
VREDRFSQHSQKTRKETDGHLPALWKALPKLAASVAVLPNHPGQAMQSGTLVKRLIELQPLKLGMKDMKRIEKD